MVVVVVVVIVVVVEVVVVVVVVVPVVAVVVVVLERSDRVIECDRKAVIGKVLDRMIGGSRDRNIGDYYQFCCDRIA